MILYPMSRPRTRARPAHLTANVTPSYAHELPSVTDCMRRGHKRQDLCPRGIKHASLTTLSIVSMHLPSFALSVLLSLAMLRSDNAKLQPQKRTLGAQPFSRLRCQLQTLFRRLRDPGQQLGKSRFTAEAAQRLWCSHELEKC